MNHKSNPSPMKINDLKISNAKGASIFTAIKKERSIRYLKSKNCLLPFNLPPSSKYNKTEYHQSRDAKQG